MKKGLYWIVLIAIGVFLGIYLHARYEEYQTRVALEQAAQQTMELLEEQRKREEAMQADRARARLERNTLCAMNADSGKCSCIHKETGQKISMSYQECVTRASSPTRP